MISVMDQNTSTQTTGTTNRDTLHPEIITVDKDADGVMCDGGHGALGHPAVWYVFDGQPSVTCGYCGRQFIKR